MAYGSVTSHAQIADANGQKQAQARNTIEAALLAVVGVPRLDRSNALGAVEQRVDPTVVLAKRPEAVDVERDLVGLPPQGAPEDVNGYYRIAKFPSASNKLRHEIGYRTSHRVVGVA